MKILDIKAPWSRSGDVGDRQRDARRQPAAPAGTRLTCTANPKSAVAGIATFAGCKLDQAGTGIVLRATATGYDTADSDEHQ